MTHRLAFAIPAILAMACSGDDDVVVVPTPTCEGLETKRLGLVEVNEWPNGTLDATARLQGMEGRYAAIDSCTGVQTFIKITTGLITKEDVPLVITPYVDGPCGCTEDAKYSADSDYPMVGVFGGASFFVENGVEVGAQGSTVFVETALFQADTDLSVRSCGELTVEPYLNSEYDRLQAIFRILGTGLLDGSYTLINEEETLECTLTDWVLIASE